MKSGLSHSLLSLTALGGLHKSLTLLRTRPHLSQSSPYNQRKARKARRARFAAGDRHAFRRRS